MIPSSATPIVGASQLAGSSIRQSPGTGTGGPAPPELRSVRAAVSALENRNSSADTNTGTTDLSRLNDAVDDLRQRSGLVNKTLRFEVIDSSNTLQVLVIDRSTDEVIREIPPDEAIQLAERIRDNLGLVLDTLA